MSEVKVNKISPRSGTDVTVGGKLITESNGDLNLYPNGTGAVEVGGNTNPGTIILNCENNSHGIKLQSPPHSANQSYTLKFPSGNVTAGRFLKVDSVSGSGTTGVGTMTFAEVSSDYVLLSSTDASNSSGVSLDLFSSTYKNYKVIVSNLSGSANDWLRVRFRRSSADVNTTSYYNANFQTARTSSATQDFNNSEWQGDEIKVFVMSGNASYVGSTEITVFDPFGTSYTQMTALSTYWENAGSSYRSAFTGAILQDATTSVTGITVSPANGNITGNVKLYGIK